MKQKNTISISRRNFIGTSSAAIAAFTIVPSKVVSGLGYVAPSDKLNIAGIGVGGRGSNVIENMAKTENIVALCDVDWSERVGKVFAKYPGAERHRDYRKMFTPKNRLHIRYMKPGY
jgi:hypothetical protein